MCLSDIKYLENQENNEITGYKIFSRIKAYSIKDAIKSEYLNDCFKPAFIHTQDWYLLNKWYECSSEDYGFHIFKNLSDAIYYWNNYNDEYLVIVQVRAKHLLTEGNFEVCDFKFPSYTVKHMKIEKLLYKDDNIIDAMKMLYFNLFNKNKIIKLRRS